MGWYHSADRKRSPRGVLFFGAYASRLDETIRIAAQSGVRLWVHGHTHHAVDYVQDVVRILSNPFGYPSEGAGVKLDIAVAT